MNKIKILTLAFLSLIITFSSCKVSSEKGKEELDDATASIALQIELVNDTEFRNAALGILNLGTDGIDLKKGLNSDNIIKIREMSLSIRNLLIGTYPKIFNKKLGSEEFSLSEYQGTYTWNSSTEEWSHENNSSSIIILFPSNNSTTNDCKLEWTKYEEIKTNDGNYFPTVIYAILTQNDKEIALVDVNMEFDLSTELPIDGDVKIKLGKLAFDVDWTFIDNILKANVSLKNGMSKINDISTELVFNNKEMDELISGNGTVKMHNVENSGGLKITFSFDNLNTIEDCNDFNDEIEIKIYTLANRYIGEVIQQEITDEYFSYCESYILFSDGTTEPVETYFNQLEKEIEIILEDLENDM
ncbi:MAG: hypothetical protein JXR68_03725 [Bacteroidales bacterium]|nr:hypothetical protein [Bacteroidales bacterium]